jgi:SnoaL-like domain
MDPMEAYRRYERAWNEPSNAAALLADAWAEDGVYADDEVPGGLVGSAALVEFIKESHAAIPGFRVWSTTEPRMLAGRMGVGWQATGDAAGTESGGTDVIEFAPDGRITRVTDVLDLD